jgi:hypothetical protein
VRAGQFQQFAVVPALGEQGGGDRGAVLPGDIAARPVAAVVQQDPAGHRDGGAHEDQLGVHAVPEHRVDQVRLGQRRLGGAVVPGHGGRVAGVGGAGYGGVEHVPDPRLDRGAHGVAVLPDPLPGRARQVRADQEQPLDAVERVDEAVEVVEVGLRGRHPEIRHPLGGPAEGE